jgi:hypothetical protein
MDTTTSPNLSSNNAALLAVALSLGAVICGAAAGAANADTTPPTSETISIADLDLSTADGARAFRSASTSLPGVPVAKTRSAARSSRANPGSSKNA